MYADDTTLFCCLEDIKNINKQDVINEQLQRIHNWLTANGLKLNTTKSKYIMFRKQNKHIPLFNIHINNVIIESVQNFNFLGLHLSSDMTWNFHINEVYSYLYSETKLLVINLLNPISGCICTFSKILFNN